MDSISGELTFWAKGPGVYCHTVEVSDGCGADTVEICVTIIHNSIPVFDNEDQKFVICEPDTICFEVYAYDPDIDDSLEIVQIEGPGVFEMTSDTSGRTCFYPMEADSAEYMFIYEATDNCLRVKCDGDPGCPKNPLDTVIVTVIMGTKPVLDCPGDTSMFICEPDTICFAIGEIPEEAVVTVEPPSAWYDPISQTVCFYTNCSVQKTIKVMVESICGVDSCMFTVDVTLNSAPVVMLPPDTNLTLCEVTEICFPAGISDIDNNLAEIIITPEGYYDEITGQICFEPTSSGSYMIVARVIDSCGVEDTDSINVQVTINTAPAVTAPADSTIKLCEPEEICFPVEIFDAEDNIVDIQVSPIGYYDNGYVCFTPDASGYYTIVITARDICDAEGTDSVTFKIKLDSPPVITAPADSSIFLCEPEEVCFPVKVSDPDSNLASVNITGAGEFISGFICFTPDTAGVYVFIIEAIDSCAHLAVDTSIIRVSINRPPVVTAPDDFDTLLCELEPICFEVEVSDPDNNLHSVSTSLGYYDAQNGLVCFTPADSGVFTIIVTATDSCYAFSSDTITVTVSLDEAVVLDCPGDTSIFICYPETLCVSVGGIPKGAAVTVSPPSAWYDEAAGSICFYTNCSVEKELKVVVENACGIDSCMFTVSVTMNSKPLVIFPPDMELTLCAPEQICVPVGISDIDNNIYRIMVSPQLASYDSLSGQLCYTPMGSGRYVLKLMALDDCGALDLDSIILNVEMNAPPVVTTAEDFEEFLCQPEEICFPVDISDPDNNLLSVEVSPSGVYNPINKEVCFTADESGTYEIIITAIDSCGVSDQGITVVGVIINSPPVVDAGNDTSIALCESEEVCIPVSADDPDDNIELIYSSIGEYANGYVCFDPGSSEQLEIIVTVIDACDVAAVDTVLVNIDLNDAPQVSSAADFEEFLCDFEEICFSVSITDPEDNIESVSTNFGFYNPQAGTVCFTPDTAGTYMIIISATDICSLTATDTTVVTVVINVPPVVDAGADTTVFQCTFEEICRSVSIIDPDNGIDSVTVNYGAYYNYGQEEVCFTPTDTGTFCLIVTAYDECGDTGRDTVCITVLSAPAAHIDCPEEPLSVSICVPSEICVPITITPASAKVTVSYGVYGGGELCIYADTAGVYNITVIASEECGADTCVVTVDVDFDQFAQIVCPELPVTASLCEPDTVQVLLPIAPPWAIITVSPIGSYDIGTQILEFFADTSGHYVIMVTAETECNIDTCFVEVNVTIEEIPQVICPDDIDTLVCLTEVTELCFEVEVIGSGATVTVLPEGYYSGGMVCIPVLEPDTMTVTVIASSVCGADTCDLEVIIRENRAPELYVPEDTILVAWCEDDTDLVCIDGIHAVDPEDDPLTIIQTCGPGTYTPVRDDSGFVCFNPTNIDSTYEFCFEATDGCSTVWRNFFVTVYPSAICSVCVDVAIETDSCYMIGANVPVRVMVETQDPIGGFDLLIGFDASVLSFWDAAKGNAISGWEYFTYRLLSGSNCGVTCPSGLLRLVAIADQNNGPFHPPQEQLSPQGILSIFTVRIINDLNVGGQYLPLTFFWIDCGDNTFSDPTGNNLYLDARIYNSVGSVIWDESDDDLFPDASRPAGMGAPDSCLIGDKVTPVRCVYFHNGWICVKHPDSIDARGDVNLNGVAYEIADAVVFTNFFIYGFKAFVTNVDGQIAATDVNGDGYTLTVADLVYLIRVITGDATGLPKISPAASLDLRLNKTPGLLTVGTEANCPLGAGHLVFEYDGIIPGIPMVEKLAAGMEMMYTIEDSQIRILIYSFDEGRVIPAECGNLISIAYEGTGDIRLVEASFATYYGENVETNIGDHLLPETFVVSQNYPNPFNPTTSIDLSLPAASQWEMTIYNIYGQVVRRMHGEAEAGTTTVVWDGRNDHGRTVASGIYLYQVRAGEFEVTRKMTMLK